MFIYLGVTRPMGTEQPREGGLTRPLLSGVWPSRAHSWLSISSQGSPLLPPPMIWITLPTWYQHSPACDECPPDLIPWLWQPAGVMLQLTGPRYVGETGKKTLPGDKSTVLEMQKWGVWTISLNCCRKGDGGRRGDQQGEQAAFTATQEAPWRKDSFPGGKPPFLLPFLFFVSGIHYAFMDSKSS